MGGHGAWGQLGSCFLRVIHLYSLVGFFFPFFLYHFYTLLFFSFFFPTPHIILAFVNLSFLLGEGELNLLVQNM